MDKVHEPEAKLRAMREFFLTKTLDRRWCLLALEFKLFAVRHPEVKQRLAAMHRRFVGPRVGFLDEVMRALGRELPASAYATGVSHGGTGQFAYPGAHARSDDDAGRRRMPHHVELLRQPDVSTEEEIQSSSQSRLLSDRG